MMPATRQRTGQLFGALAHPARLRITELLCQGERTVNEIAATLDLSQSGTSQHLAILTRAGVLVVEPRGAARLYRVRGPRIARVLALIEEFCETHELYGVAEEVAEEEGSVRGFKNQVTERGTETTRSEANAVREDAGPQLEDAGPLPAADYRWYSEHTALLVSTLKWAVLGTVAGLCVGLGTKAFLALLGWATQATLRLNRGWFQYYDLLPLALPLCVWLVRTFAPTAKGHGTEAVITAIHTRSGRINLAVAPVKLIATILTLAFGGSVGKEGPCAQIGASITSAFADLLRLPDEDRRRLVICGIGAGFGAVFGTPISGALFGIEVLYLGRIEYSVLFPCLIASIVAHLVCGGSPPVPAIHDSFGRLTSTALVLLCVGFGALCGLIALALIETMSALERGLERFSSRPYALAAGGGLLLAVLYHLFGSSYAGLGSGTIEAALSGGLHLLLLGFAVKIVATAVTLEVGGSGGIITPLFFIGSTAGLAFAHLFHLPAGAFAAFGFVAVVAAAANTPIAAAVMGIELLPGPVGVYAALCACTAYLIVGHRSVYASQKLGFSKSAGLDVPLGETMGSLVPGGVRVRPGSMTARLHSLRRVRRWKGLDPSGEQNEKEVTHSPND